MIESYADVLESYMIAEEAENNPKTWKDAGKSIAVKVGVFAVLLAAIGIKHKLSERKEDKQRKENQAKLDNESKMKQKEAFNKLDSKYNISSMSKNEYDRFVNKMYDQIIIDINKILKPLNSKEILNEFKNEYIDNLKDMIKRYPENAKEYNDDIKNADRIFKPGLFKICDNQIGDYVCIIDGDQEVNTICHDICENVADALMLKYSDFCDAGLFGVGTGDGDEGCVYPEFVSYETLRKIID